METVHNAIKATVIGVKTPVTVHVSMMHKIDSKVWMGVYEQWNLTLVSGCFCYNCRNAFLVEQGIAS